MLMRRVFAIVAGVSFVLCMAVASLGVRSFWVGDSLAFRHFVRHSTAEDHVYVLLDYYERYYLVSGRAKVAIVWEPESGGDPSEPFASYKRDSTLLTPPDPNPTPWRRL